MKICKFILALSLVCSLEGRTASSPSELAFKADPSFGEVKFIAIGNPSFLKIEGIGAGPEGKLKHVAQKLSGSFSFTLESLKTGMKKRDEHMRGYLHTTEHPKATLEVSDLSVPADFLTHPEKHKRLPFKGKLTLNGQTKDIEGSFEAKTQGKKLELLSDFNLQLTQFGIEIPEFAGITVADKVDVSVRAPLESVP